jgi:arylsulfatase A-like enzyme
MDDGPQQGRRPHPKRRAALLLAAAACVLGILWMQPRADWSLADRGRDSVPGFAPIPEDVRRVVLISIDTLRADHLGCYGYSRDTSPNLDALAAEGVRFNHAVSAAPTTLPSHATLFTGTTPLAHGVHANVGYRLDESQLTLAELLRRNGFATAAFVGAYVLDPQFGIAQGFDRYDAGVGTARDNSFHNERSAEATTALVNQWLADRGEEPFFLFVHYYDPHSPYELHADYEFPSLPLLSFPRDSYDSEIAYTDHQVGLVIDQLKRLGLYDSSLLIVTGDHGEAHGDHAEDLHGFFLYHATVHVPLIIKPPGRSIARRVDDVVGLVDVTPTVCSLVGVEIPDHVEGVDLSAFLAGGPPPVEGRSVFSETLQPTAFGAAPLTSLTTDRWKYIHSVRPELYDLARDPREAENRIDAAPPAAAPIRAELLALLARHDGEAAVAGSGAVDEETLQRLQSLGYVGQITAESVQIRANQADAKDVIAAWSARNHITARIAEGRLEEARRLAAELLESHPQVRDPFVLEFLAAEAMRAGDYAAAAQRLDQLLAIGYEPYKVHISFGAVLTQLGEYGDAVAHFDAALAIDRDSPYAYMALANSFAAAGQFDRAVATARKALALDAVQRDPELARDLRQQLRAHQAGRVRRSPPQP